MKRLQLNTLSRRGDNATSERKHPWKIALTRTVWIAPALGLSSVAVLLALLSIVDTSHSQTTATATAPDWAGKPLFAATDMLTVIPANDPAMTDPDANDPSDEEPPHLSKGGKWALFGTARRDLDPLNHFNEVISFDTHDPNAIAGAVRKFGPHTKLGMLTDQVELKYYYVGRTCGGGSTRFQLGLDLDGDGKMDINAFGYLGDKAFGGGCVMNQWVFEDMTDGAPKWDTSQLPVTDPCRSFVTTWASMVSCITAEYPNHQVLNAVLVDDSQSFFLADSGCAFFDQVAAGRDTLDEWDDTTGPGNQTANHCSN
jgi:hypothetical protein